jgi:hypothetical protein
MTEGCHPQNYQLNNQLYFKQSAFPLPEFHQFLLQNPQKPCRNAINFVTSLQMNKTSRKTHQNQSFSHKKTPMRVSNNYRNHEFCQFLSTILPLSVTQLAK